MPRRIEISTLPPAGLRLPAQLEGLQRLAYNHYWMWHPRVRVLFRRIDVQAWLRHRNPVPVLQQLRDCGHFDHALVAIQLDYIASSFQHRLASRASAEVFVHRHAQRGIHIAFDVIRDLLPHLLAIDSYHGLVPFSKGSRLNQPCSHPPASRSRNIRRARNNRVFTEATEIPRASAVS